MQAEGVSPARLFNRKMAVQQVGDLSRNRVDRVGLLHVLGAESGQERHGLAVRAPHLDAGVVRVEADQHTSDGGPGERSLHPGTDDPDPPVIPLDDVALPSPGEDPQQGEHDDDSHATGDRDDTGPAEDGIGLEGDRDQRRRGSGPSHSHAADDDRHELAHGDSRRPDRQAVPVTPLPDRLPHPFTPRSVDTSAARGSCCPRPTSPAPAAGPLRGTAADRRRISGSTEPPGPGHGSPGIERCPGGR